MTCALLRSLYCNRTNFDFKVSKALRPRLTTGLPTIQFIPFRVFTETQLNSLFRQNQTSFTEQPII